MSYWFRHRVQLIAKFNPYHDDKGHFASAGGSTVAARMVEAVKNGGFTYDPAGKVPTQGFSVGVFPEKSTSLPVEAVTKQKVSDWMAKNTALLSKHGNMLGGWVDKGTLYLDIVKVFPPNQKTEAMAAGKEHNQLSIADLDAIHRGDWDHAIIDTGGDGKNGDVQKRDQRPHLVLATPDTSVVEFLDRLGIKPR